MYTRSFPSRRMPPDYGGTALVIGNQRNEEQRGAITDPTLDRRSRRPSVLPPEIEDDEEIRSPFGSFGQDAPTETLEEVSPSAAHTPTVSAEPLSFDRLKSDDLLLLGIALLLFSDKENTEGIPTDALLILALLFFCDL